MQKVGKDYRDKLDNFTRKILTMGIFYNHEFSTKDDISDILPYYNNVIIEEYSDYRIICRYCKACSLNDKQYPYHVELIESNRTVNGINVIDWANGVR